MNDFTATIQKWWAQPFASNMSAGQWFLFIGLLIVIIIAWRSVVGFITEG